MEPKKNKIQKIDILNKNPKMIFSRIFGNLKWKKSILENMRAFHILENLGK